MINIVFYRLRNEFCGAASVFIDVIFESFIINIVNIGFTIKCELNIKRKITLCYFRRCFSFMRKKQPEKLKEIAITNTKQRNFFLVTLLDLFR